MKRYEWEGIYSQMVSFARVEDITDIIVLGDKGSMRRIIIGEDSND